MNSGRRRVRVGFRVCPDETPPLGAYGTQEEKEHCESEAMGSHHSDSHMDVDTHRCGRIL